MARSNQASSLNAKLRKQNHPAMRFLKALTALLALLGFLILPSSASAQESQTSPAAQVGDETYATLQDAFDHVSMKHTSVTLLSDVSEQVTVSAAMTLGSITLDLNGHTLRSVEDSTAAAITIPAETSLTIIGQGTIDGGQSPAIDCYGALYTKGGSYVSKSTLMRFAETEESSAEGYFSAGTYTAPTLFEALGSAEYLGYVTIRGGEFHGTIPSSLNTLAILDGSFSDATNIPHYLANGFGLIHDDTMFRIAELSIVSGNPSVELTPSKDLQSLSNDGLLELTGTGLNAIADYRLVADSQQLQLANDAISTAIQAVRDGKSCDSFSQEITITAVRNTVENADTVSIETRSAEHDTVSATVRVTIGAVTEQHPQVPNEPEQSKRPELSKTGSAVLAVASIALLLTVISIACMTMITKHHLQ